MLKKMQQLDRYIEKEISQTRDIEKKIREAEEQNRKIRN